MADLEKLGKVALLSSEEVALIERLSGLSMRQWWDPTAPVGNLNAAYAFVVEKRNNEDVNFADYLAKPYAENDEIIERYINATLGDDEEGEPDPTGGAPAPS